MTTTDGLAARPDMSEPHRRHERIWLLPHDGEQVTWCDHDASEAGDGQEYVRADLVDAQAAEIARLKEDAQAAHRLERALREAVALVEEYSCRTDVGHIATECETVAAAIRALPSTPEEGA